jgi:hypothetical protein
MEVEGERPARVFLARRGPLEIGARARPGTSFLFEATGRRSQTAWARFSNLDLVQRRCIT